MIFLHQLILPISFTDQILLHLQNKQPYSDSKTHYMRSRNRQRARRALSYDPLQIEKEFMKPSHLSNTTNVAFTVIPIFCPTSSIHYRRNVSCVWLMYATNPEAALAEVKIKWRFKAIDKNIILSSKPLLTIKRMMLPLLHQFQRLHRRLLLDLVMERRRS